MPTNHIGHMPVSKVERAVISVKTLRSFRELDTLADLWNELLTRSHNNNMFLTWEWVSCWVRSYLRDGQLRCLAVYEESKLVAIAPLWIDEVRVGGILRVRVLKFVGGKEVCSDHLDFIVGCKNHRPPARAIWDHLFGELGREWDVLEYYQVPSNSTVLEVFRTLAEQDRRCIRNAIEEYTVCPYIVLPGSWDEYVAGLSTNQRRAWRVSTRQLAQHGPLELRICESPDALPGDLQQLIELNRRNWNERGQPGSFATPQFIRFHELIAGNFLARGMLFLCSLWLNDQHLGSFYGFAYNKTVYFYVIGVDRHRFPGVNIGRVLLGMCVQESIRRGNREFDLLRGNEEYKYQWTDRDRRNLSLSFHNCTSRALALILYRFVHQFTRQVAKALLWRRQPAAAGTRPSATSTPKSAT